MWGVAAALVAAAAAVGFSVHDRRVAGARPVWLVNGLGFDAYEVEVDGRPHTVPAVGRVRLSLAEGVHRVKILPPPAAGRAGADLAAPVPAPLRPQAFEVPGNLWSRHLGKRVLVLNPDRSASLRVVTYAYGPGEATPIKTTRLPPALLHGPAGIDDPFRPPREAAYARRRGLGRVTRRRLTLTDASPAVAVPYLLVLAQVRDDLKEEALAAAEAILSDPDAEVGFPVRLHREVLTALRR